MSGIKKVLKIKSITLTAIQETHMSYKNLIIFPIILFIFFFRCPLLLALEIYRTDNVLVSREDGRTPSNPLIKHELYENNNILVSKKDSGFFIGDFVIRHEKYKTGKALVSRPVPTDMAVLDVLKGNNIRSIESYVQWLQGHIEYRVDEALDTWSFPEETLERKYGDCEDYAFLNAAVLRVLGYQPKVLAIGMLRVAMGRFLGSHAICVFEKDGKYLWFDNGTLKKTKASSLDEFAKYIFAEYDCSNLSEIDLNTGGRNILFTKSNPTVASQKAPQLSSGYPDHPDSKQYPSKAAIQEDREN